MAMGRRPSPNSQDDPLVYTCSVLLDHVGRTPPSARDPLVALSCPCILPLQEKNMKPSDLWTVLPKSRVSEILSGKRGISKTQARQLAELFRVPVDLFL
jgi:hypothetical protein